MLVLPLLPFDIASMGPASLADVPVVGHVAGLVVLFVSGGGQYGVLTAKRPQRQGARGRGVTRVGDRRVRRRLHQPAVRRLARSELAVTLVAVGQTGAFVALLAAWFVVVLRPNRGPVARNLRRAAIGVSSLC